MNYYLLTDRLRAGQIVREDGRKHYRFVFGSYCWERTTLFQAYLTEGTGCFGMYRAVTEEQAMDLLMQHGRRLAGSLQKAQTIAEQVYADRVDEDGEPYIQHLQDVADALVDWDEKIVALLQGICEGTPWTVQKLQGEGFPPYICLAVDLLTRKEGVGGDLRAVRQNRIARNVKIMALSRTPGPTESERRYDKALRYLRGDDTVSLEEIDQLVARPPAKAWRSSEAIYKAIYPLALGGRKIPHGVSNPVLRDRNGQLCLAFFVYTYSREELQKGAVRRPCSWITADVVDGQLLEEISCSVEDFSNASNEERYPTENPSGTKPGAFFKEAYAILDKVRQGYGKTGRLPESVYREYLDVILQAVPPAYHRFYRELSL